MSETKRAPADGGARFVSGRGFSLYAEVAEAWVAGGDERRLGDILDRAMGAVTPRAVLN